MAENIPFHYVNSTCFDMGSASKRIAIIVIDNILQFRSLLQFFDFSLKLLVYLPNEISPNYKFQTMVASPVLYFKVFGLIIQEWI